MAIQPGTYNFTLQAGADFSLVLEFKDSNSAAIDITGWTAKSQAWNETRSKKYADFAIAYTDRANGKITISLTDTQTREFPKTLYYDVLLIDDSDVKEYYLEGQITTSIGYTQ